MGKLLLDKWVGGNGKFTHVSGGWFENKHQGLFSS
jgi:hypothetical protein